MTKIFKVGSLLSCLLCGFACHFGLTFRARLLPVRSYRISRESFFPCQNIALLPDLIYPAQRSVAQICPLGGSAQCRFSSPNLLSKIHVRTL